MSAVGLASRIVLLVSALELMMVFIYYECDITAKMTSKPANLPIKSFNEVEELGYKVGFPV